MGGESDGKPRFTLDKLHLSVTIAIAVLGGFISWQQYQISSWVDQQKQELERRKTLTEQSTALLTRTKDYLDTIGLDADKKRRVMISLLEIEKELRVGKSGELSDTAVNALPYHIALLAGDDEALAHIGAGAEALGLWVPIAKTSADIKVREAAIKALRNVALLTNDVGALRTCVNSIIELTQRWNVVELRAQASEAITTIADAYRTEGGDSAEINAILGDALRELEGAIAVATAPPIDSPGATPTPPAAYAEASDIARQQTSAAEQAQIAAVRDLRQFYAQNAGVTGLDESAINELLERLRSEDPKERRVTRSRLSDYGKEAIPALLDLLETNRSEYRVRVGVATALMLMEQPVPLTPQEAKRAVQLLGDADATVRKNTTVFLGELTDPDAIEATRQALQQISTDRANLGNGNLVYNSVIVLGDWLRYNPAISDEARPRIRASLQAVASALGADTERQWENTRAKIKEYLG